MKRIKMKKTMLGFMMIMILFTLTACQSKSSGNTQSQNDFAVEQSYDAGVSYGAGESASAIDMESVKTKEATDAASPTEITKDVSQISGQKLIKDVTMSVETRTFDAFITEITKQIESLGGYIERADVSGGSYQYENYRYGNVVARIPADKLDGFTTRIKEQGNVVHISEQTTDVTLQYVDIESHLKALRIEQETLLGLLEKAEKMEDVIAIQSQLTQVRYEIESNESQIRTYDNLVNYSTVRIDITEVERETAPENKSFFGEIKVKLSDNLYAMKMGIRNLLVELIASLPYLIVFGIVIVILIIATKKVLKKHPWNKKKDKIEEKAEEKDEK